MSTLLLQGGRQRRMQHGTPAARPPPPAAAAQQPQSARYPRPYRSRWAHRTSSCALLLLGRALVKAARTAWRPEKAEDLHCGRGGAG